MNLAHVKQGVLVLTCLSHIECWPYPVIKNLNCDAIVVVFIMATVVLASMISFGIWYNPQLPSNFQCHIEILLDNSEGNTMRWNSNDIRISFTIFDDQFNPKTSTVIVNTFQSNCLDMLIRFLINYFGTEFRSQN